VNIVKHLSDHYGVDADVHRIPRGRADNYLAARGAQRWLFKVFQPEYTLSRVEQIAAFVDFVVAAGYPTENFVATVNGAKSVMLGQRVAVLIPWIAGTAPEPNTVTSPRMLRDVGALCGRMHRIAAAYRPTPEYAGSGSSVGAKRASLMKLAADEGSDPEIREEVDQRLEILEKWGDALARSHEQAQRGMIHGDFTAAHVIFHEERAVGVIDVTGEFYLPGWELLRAFCQSVPLGTEPPEALEHPWRVFVDGYTREQRLTANDVAVAYDVYLLQLAGSTYGLRRPLDNELRDFGRWRTRTAGYLSQHRQILRPLLARCAD
jgi:Ser/Thr protein kinase RdoA (MazF antagonist)